MEILPTLPPCPVLHEHLSQILLFLPVCDIEKLWGR